MEELREFYIESVQSTRRTLNSILNILQQQEDTFTILFDSARNDIINNNQTTSQTRSTSGSQSTATATGRRRARSLFEINRTNPTIARQQLQRRRIFNSPIRETSTQAMPTAAARPAPNLFSIPGMAPGVTASANRREVNLADILLGTITTEMNASLNPVVVRPSARQIEATTEIIPYSDIPENDRIEECPISREPFTETSAVMRICHCRHYFAPESLRTWFNSSVRCPICRHDIRSTLSDNLANEYHVEEDEPEDDDDDAEIDEETEEDGSNNTVQTSSEPSQSSNPTVTISSHPNNTTFMNADGTTSFISANPLGDLMNIINNDTQNLNNNTSLTYTIDFTPYFNDISGNIN